MPRMTALLLVALSACSARSTRHRDPVFADESGAKERLQQLRARESLIRSAFRAQAQAPWIDVSGADPYRIAALGSGFVGLLRGGKALVTLDSKLSELARVQLDEAPTALCVADAKAAWVASRYAGDVWRVDLQHHSAQQASTLSAGGVADLACGESGLVYVLTSEASQLVTLDAAGRVRDRRPAMAGGLRLQRRGRYLLELSLFERSLRVLALDALGVPSRELGRIRHDGALWAFDAWEHEHQLLIAVAGAENAPLVRIHGEFENIDSFGWIYRLGDAGLKKLVELDLSDSGVVVPKAVGLTGDGERITLTALAAGSGRWLRASWPHDFQGLPEVQARPALPGATDAVFAADGSVAYASPLFDAWVELDAQGTRLSRVDSETRPALDVRLGEALFFTELMAPSNASTGPHSRFTCETCHFEGGVDGRTHYSGRADVSVVTKPLFGLSNNRPHFSRAMDADLSSVSHNEFRVAGAGSGSDPWFTLESSRFPWLQELGVARAELRPLELREALMQFLYAFSHAPNPRSQRRSGFSPVETEGAKLFEQRCSVCHQARLLSDEPSSVVAFDDWQKLIFSRNSPIVWARAEHEKTGVLPYVHPLGTRVTSLRRLALKPRYFSNGSAPELTDVLLAFRYGSGGASHVAATSPAFSSSLSQAQRSALLAFLRLL